MPTNIVKRQNSASYYFRRAFPRDVAEALGKREFTKSLGTADLAEARERAHKAEFEFRQAVNIARRETGPSEGEVQDWLVALYEREVKLVHHEEFSQSSRSEIKDRESLDSAELYKSLLVNSANTLDLNGSSEWAVDEAIERFGWKVAPEGKGYGRLAQLAAQALLEARNRVKERKSGNDSGEPKSLALRKAYEVKSKKASPTRSPRITDVFELYAKENAHLRPDTLDQNRKIVRRFAEFVGDDADVSCVVRANVRDWKFKLRDWPKKASELREFRGLGFNEVIEANNFAKKPTIDDRTVAKYLAALGGFGGWLVGNGYIEENPTSGLMPAKKAKAKRDSDRRPFTVPELNMLFSSPLFATCGGDRREHEPGDVVIRDDRYWLFPLGLFTGARQAELCQLRRKDVREQDGIWFLDIVEDAGDTQLKSAASARAVPLHPALLELGFLDHVDKIPRNGRLFPRCERNGKGQFGETSKWLSRYLTRTGVKTDGALTFHSLRHTFIDALRRADFAEAEIQPLIGHSASTVTRGYGRERDATIKRRSEMVAAVAYPGLVWPPRRA